MAESWEHKSLKGLLGSLLGGTECQTLGGRVDACSPLVTAEIECGPKKNDVRTCRIDLRLQPDVKIREMRQKPFASFYMSSSQIKALEPVLKNLQVKVSRSRT